MSHYHKTLAIIALLLMNVCGSISMDIHLPAAPLIQCEFGCSVASTQMIFIVSVALMALTPLLWGRYSDIMGRRLLCILVSTIMTVGQFLCAFSDSIEFLIFARVIQYFGQGGILAVTIAMICDLYDGQERARILALREMSVPLGLVIAPIIGGYTAIHWGWRYNFWVLGIIQTFLIAVFVFYFPKSRGVTTVDDQCEGFFKKRIFSNVLRNKNFVLYSILLAFTNASYMVFMTHSSFLYLDHWQVSTKYFAISHSLLAVLYFFGLFLFGFLLKIIRVAHLVNIGMFLFCGFGLAILLYCVNVITHGPLNLLFIMYFSCIASGLVIAGSTVLAMQFSDKALYGTYAAFLGMAESGVAAAFMAASSVHQGSMENSMMLYMALSIIVSLLIWLKMIKEKSGAEI